MPIVNDLLAGNRGGGPRVSLHLNWHATEILTPCKHILRFRDLPTSAVRRLGSNKKLIPSMLRHAGHAKISLWRALNAQASSLNLQLF